MGATRALPENQDIRITGTRPCAAVGARGQEKSAVRTRKKRWIQTKASLRARAEHHRLRALERQQRSVNGHSEVLCYGQKRAKSSHLCFFNDHAFAASQWHEAAVSELPYGQRRPIDDTASVFAVAQKKLLLGYSSAGRKKTAYVLYVAQRKQLR
jgi:hypothetical protein